MKNKRPSGETTVIRLFKADCYDEDQYLLKSCGGDLVTVIGYPLARFFMIGQLTVEDLKQMN